MAPSRMRVRKIADFAFCVLFMVVLWLPSYRQACSPRLEVSITEGRQLAKMPDLRLSRKFIDNFEPFYCDHFGFREELLAGFYHLELDLIKVSPSPHVVFGSRKWLFYNEQRPGMDLQRVRPFTPDELTQWQRVLENRQRWLAARGIQFFFVMAPDKQSIYPERLPKELQERISVSRLDQLLAYIRANSNVCVVDLRDDLLAAKAEQDLYFKLDSHWNYLGAFVGYKGIVRELNKRFPKLHPYERSQYKEEIVQTSGDLARMLGRPRWTEENNVLTVRNGANARGVDPGLPLGIYRERLQPVARETGDTSLPKAVVFRDSFMSIPEQFLSEHFQRVVYVWTYDFIRSIIEKERPDLVILEMVERQLGSPPPIDE